MNLYVGTDGLSWHADVAGLALSRRMASDTRMYRPSQHGAKLKASDMSGFSLAIRLYGHTA